VGEFPVERSDPAATLLDPPAIGGKSRGAKVGHHAEVTDSQNQARALVLEQFRWHNGHADLAGVFRDAQALAALGPALAAPFASSGVGGVVAIEARGFVVGALAAQHLGVGMVLARKPGSMHPDAVRRTSTSPDWRGRHTELAISLRAVVAGDRLLLVDDWIETGSQARTAFDLVAALGASVVGTSVVVDDTTEEVRASLGVVGLLRADELPPVADEQGGSSSAGNGANRKRSST
jgi:adenine phosphoribosyltransferase